MSRRALGLALATVLTCGFVAGSLTSSAAQTSTSELVYVVEPGDSWFGIAAKLHTAPAFLAVENGATFATRLYPGRILHHIEGASPPATSTTTTEVTTSPSTSSTTTAPASATTTPVTLPPASSTTSSSTSPTTVPASSSTSSTTPSTSPATSTTSPGSTSTSTTPPTSTTAPGAPACGLASAAFCDTFDAPAGTGTQTGDLNPVVWGVSRIGDMYQENGVTPSHNACANGAVTPPPLDARICNGQYVESNNDGGAVTLIAAYPKQPFDFTGRTGKVVFDVSNDTSGTHGAWPDFTITDEPVPGVMECITECNLGENSVGTAKNEVGFDMAHASEQGNTWSVERIWVSKNGVLSDVPVTRYGDVTKGSRAAMNHVEVRVSTTRIDIYATNAGSSTLVHLAGADLALGFSKGLIWINDAHYNARKAIEPNATGKLFDHSFAWDNVGFDGPKTYRDLGYDVPLAKVVTNDQNQNGDGVLIAEGYTSGTSRTFSVTGVSWVQPYATAKVVLNAYAAADNPTLTISLNGHTEHAQTVSIAEYHPQARALAFPSSDVVAGTNTIKITSNAGNMVVANVTLILVAAAPVP